MLYFSKTVLKQLAVCLLPVMLVLTTTIPSAWSDVPGRGTIQAAWLNVRSKPNRNAALVTSLKRGTTVKILEDLGPWLKIQHNQTTGYIRNRNRYVHVDEPPRSGKIAELKEKAREIDQKIKRHKTDLEAYVKKEAQLIEGLNQIDIAMHKARQQVDALSEKMDAVNQAIDENREAARILEQRIRENKQYASKRLVALYKLHMLGKMNVLGSADSMYEFLKTRRDIQFIYSHDMEMLENYLEDKDRLSKLTRRLNQEKEEKLALEKKLTHQISILETEKAKRERFLTDIRQKESLRKAALEDLKQAARALDQTIASLHVEPGDNMQHLHGDFSAQRGLLKMPVEGKIITRFGKYKNDRLNIVNFRSGINIAAERGEPVRAVYRGQVLYATWFKGYGNMIIIDHGNSYYTVYAHAQELFKKKGDYVETYEVIATVGDTASLTGTSLYFEVRHKGTPVNPVAWLNTG
ncbi:MAG: peptidoglycan DD-metalloendopeptidase family protein [Thermodesulfobacteriota bacterium]|nr:peptidoglycan DD-metalloendopeptidase family protein [Thermodesulfobacteriota bacterium]